MKKMNLLDDHEIYTSNDYSGLSFGNDQPLVIKYRGYSLLYDDQELIKKFVCEMFELVDFSVEFERIARGCISLIYRITDSVRRYLLEYRITGGKLASCAKYNILCFIIGDMELKVPLEHVVTDEVCDICDCLSKNPPCSHNFQIVLFSQYSWITKISTYYDEFWNYSARQ